MRHDPNAATRALSSIERAVVTHLQANGRMGYAAIGKELGLSDATIRRLVKRLIDEEVIAITAVADPRLLGLDAMAWIGLRVDWSSASDLTAKMLEIRGIDYVATTTGSFQIFAEIGAKDPVEMVQRISQVRGLDGVRSSETFFYLDLFHQEYSWLGPGDVLAEAGRGVRTGKPIGELEQQIILALREDGRRSFRQIAKRLGVPEHRVRRAFTAMTRSDAVRVTAVLNPARMGLRTMALLGIRATPSVGLRKAAEAVAAAPRVDYLVICTGQYDLIAEVACTGPDELAEVLESIAALDSIQEIDVFSYLQLQYRDESVWSVGRVSALDIDTPGT